MGKPILKSETDQRDVMTILRDTRPDAYAAMMRRETIQPKPLSTVSLTNFDAMLKEQLIKWYPATNGVPPPPLAPNPFLSMIKKQTSPSTPYKIEALTWRLAGQDVKVVADPTLPRDACYAFTEQDLKKWREALDKVRDEIDKHDHMRSEK